MLGVAIAGTMLLLVSSHLYRPLMMDWLNDNRYGLLSWVPDLFGYPLPAFIFTTLNAIAMALNKVNTTNCHVYHGCPNHIFLA